MCEFFSRCQAVFDSLNIPHTYLNSAYNHCACAKCRTSAEEKEQYSYFALKTDPRKNLKEILENWDKCYHGTNMKKIQSLVKTGLLIPGDSFSDMEEIDLKMDIFPKRRFLFGSPDMNYCLVNTLEGRVQIDKHFYQFLFDLRFKPHEYSNGGTRWSACKIGSVVQIGILIVEDYEKKNLTMVYFQNPYFPVPMPAPIAKKRYVCPSTKGKLKIAHPHVIKPKICKPRPTHPWPYRKPGPKKPPAKIDSSKLIMKVVTGCGLCDIKEKVDTLMLECGHEFHRNCIQQYILVITEGRVVFSSKEAKKYSVSCNICQKQIPEKMLKIIFDKHFDSFDIERKVREAEEGKELKHPPKEEVKLPRVEQYWLSCCQKEVPLEEYKNLIGSTKDSIFMLSKDNELL